MSVCVDAGLIIKCLVCETDSDEALAWLSAHEQDELLAPALIAAEVASVLRKKVQRGEISEGQAEEALDIFAALDIKLVWDYPLIQRAFRLSCQLDRPNVYDAAYLALAERERCDLWTADLRFVHVAAQSYPFIRSLG